MFFLAVCNYGVESNKRISASHPRFALLPPGSDKGQCVGKQNPYSERVMKVIVKAPWEIKHRSVLVCGSSGVWKWRLISHSTLFGKKKSNQKTQPPFVLELQQAGSWSPKSSLCL